MGRYWKTTNFEGSLAGGQGSDDIVDALGLEIDDVEPEFCVLHARCDYETIGKYFIKIFSSFDEHAVPPGLQKYRFHNGATLQSYINGLSQYYKADNESCILQIALAVVNELSNGNDCVIAVDY